MSDLSNLLGDVYGDASSPDAAPVRHEPAAADRVPEWSEESRLDRAFAGWEPESRGGFEAAPAPSRPAVDDDLAAALSAALTESAPMAPPAPVAAAPIVAPVPAPAPVAAVPASWVAPAVPAPAPAAAAIMAPTQVAAAASVRMWAPGDDDIFPAGRSAKAPKAAKAPKVKRKG